MEILEAALPSDTMNEISRLMVESRGAPYRRIETLALSPSRDIAAIATTQAKRCLQEKKGLGRLARSLLKQAVTEEYQGAGDLASHLLFDGGYAEVLIRLGREDAQQRAGELRSFFGSARAKAHSTADDST